jgi:tRNA(fMet)-specific endonuclease VapC
VKYLLDTNTCIAVMRNHPHVVVRMLATTPGECAASAITAYELFTGVEKCAQPARERPKVERSLRTVHLLPFDFPVATESARIRATLEARGQTIGAYDMLLAGHSLALALILATHNLAEFRRVDALEIEDWQTPQP